jgi:hypothetical protein
MAFAVVFHASAFPTVAAAQVLTRAIRDFWLEGKRIPFQDRCNGAIAFMLVVLKTIEEQESRSLSDPCLW